MSWLAYAHPAWMLVAIAFAILALRAGLALRRTRTGPARRRPGMRRRHLRLAKPAVALVLLGFLGGPISSVWLRDWAPLQSFHGLLGVVVVAFFVAVALLGRRLERGDWSVADAHALLGGLAVLGAAVAAVAGFILLP